MILGYPSRVPGSGCAQVRSNCAGVWEWVAWVAWGLAGCGFPHTGIPECAIRAFGIDGCALLCTEFTRVSWRKTPKSAVFGTKIQVRVVCPKWPDKKYRQKGQKAAEKPGFDPPTREPPKWPKSAGPPLRTPPKSAY